MKLKMLKTIHAAANEAGSISKDYEALKEYDVFEELANVFLINGWAIKTKENESKEIEIKEEKMVVEVVENKMIDNSPENKTKKTKKK